MQPVAAHCAPPGNGANGNVDAKRAVDKNMQTVLSVLNVPSRADFHRVLTKIEALQGSLVNLNIKLDRMMAGMETKKRTSPRRPARATREAGEGS